MSLSRFSSSVLQQPTGIAYGLVGLATACAPAFLPEFATANETTLPGSIALASLQALGLQSVTAGAMPFPSFMTCPTFNASSSTRESSWS